MHTGFSSCCRWQQCCNLQDAPENSPSTVQLSLNPVNAPRSIVSVHWRQPKGAYASNATMRTVTRHCYQRSIHGCARQHRSRCVGRLASKKTMDTNTTVLFNGLNDKTQLQLTETANNPTTIHPVLKTGLDSFLDRCNDPLASAWARINNFRAKSGELLLVPSADGAISSVLVGLESHDDMWAYAALPGKLPQGTYQIALDNALGAGDGQQADAAPANKALLGWIMGCYKFSRYKTGMLDNKDNKDQQQQPIAVLAAGPDVPKGTQSGAENGSQKADDKPLLVVPKTADKSSVYALAAAWYWCRDMINTPAEDMGPQHLVTEAQALVNAHKGAHLDVLEGDELLRGGYPAIHTVGRAAARPPALIDISWAPTGRKFEQGSPELPLLALVGKGVCFDSGGLDIKTAAGMKLMKKDMGGGALMLALAHVIMSAQLPVRLRVLVPAVENAISGNAYRPGDVLQTRSGLTVENGNTDAEGRLILCDAISRAAQESPDVIIDAATLTGAARVALGPELPAVFSTCDKTWDQLSAAANRENDPMWRLPLWTGYRKALESKVADLSSTGEPGTAGAITAALFLAEFAKACPSWVHIDTAGWVSGSSCGPGRPEGGEALALRALWRFCQDRYGSRCVDK